MSSVKHTTEHPTADDARAEGQAFKDAWGWGYDGTYRVWYDATDDVWVCETSRSDSCD